MRLMRKLTLSLTLLLAGAAAHGADFIYVPNMGQLNWQLASDGKAYLRNLNQFNASFAGCCYSIWVDTTTPAGKALWAAMLMKMAAAQPMWLGLANAAGGQIEYAGQW